MLNSISTSAYLLGAESDFLGLIDLLEMKELRWKDESLGAEFVIEDINDALLDDAKKWREQMIRVSCRAR